MRTLPIRVACSARDWGNTSGAPTVYIEHEARSHAQTFTRSHVYIGALQPYMGPRVRVRCASHAMPTARAHAADGREVPAFVPTLPLLQVPLPIHYTTTITTSSARSGIGVADRPLFPRIQRKEGGREPARWRKRETKKCSVIIEQPRDGCGLELGPRTLAWQSAGRQAGSAQSACTPLPTFLHPPIRPTVRLVRHIGGALAPVGAGCDASSSLP